MVALELNLRRATAADAAALAALSREAYGKYVARIGMEPIPLAADYAALIAQDIVWLLEDAAGHIDAALVLQQKPGHLLLWSIAVSPRRQKGGLGRRLMAFVEDQAIGLGYREIRLYTNQLMVENRRFYEALGYQQTGMETIEGRHAVHYAKRLNAPPA